MAGISDYIEQFVLDKLKRFNEGRSSGKGVYYILLPTVKTAYYTLWFYNPKAIYHFFVFIGDLDINAMSSVNKAIKILTNTYSTLQIINQITPGPDNGDDIILFGKYRGYHLHEIYTIDPRYVCWIADKYEPHVKSEQRFKELAETYRNIYLDLQTYRIYKTPVSQHIGTIGDKLTSLVLTISRVRIEDNPYKTKVVGGTPYFYVDQKIVATDNAGNLYFFTIKATDRSLQSGVLNNAAHAYQSGEKLLVKSAKVLKHYTSRNIKYTKLGYLKLA